jgi:hypothetical protein
MPLILLKSTATRLDLQAQALETELDLGGGSAESLDDELRDGPHGLAFDWQAQSPAAELAFHQDRRGRAGHQRRGLRADLPVDVRLHGQLVIVFSRPLDDPAVQGPQQLGERGKAEVALVEGGVEPLDQRPDRGLERPGLAAPGGEHAHRLDHQVGRVFQRGQFLGGLLGLGSGGGAGGRQVAVEAELVAGELVAARRPDRADTDEEFALPAAPLRQGGVVAIRGDDHDVRQVGMALKIVGHVEDEPDIGAILRARQREQLDQIHRVRLQLIAVAAVILPIAVSPVYHDAAECRRIFHNWVDIDDRFLRPEPAGPVGACSARIVHQTGVHVLEIPVDGYRRVRIGHCDPFRKGQDCQCDAVRSCGCGHRGRAHQR